MAESGQVAWVTFALLALVVGAMVGLNTVGIAQVHASFVLLCAGADTCVFTVIVSMLSLRGMIVIIIL